jgi:Bifunctional DNA primase/polymerase, N-terminal
MNSVQPLRRLERVTTRDAGVPYSADDPTMENGWRNIPIPPTDDPGWFILGSSSDKSNGLGPLARCGGQRMSDDATLLTALAFARHGHAVFPVTWPVARNGRLVCSCGSDSRGRPCGNSAKHPYGKLAPNGLRSATTESGIIKHWWGYLAPQANLGVCTDALVVIDIDPRHGGDESFAALEREHELPPTWRVLTGGGGEHVLFAAPDRIEIANVVAELIKPPQEPPLGRGIDVRARGGYIVAPPSKHISGRAYTWSVDHHPAYTALACAPRWLVETLARRAGSDGGNRHDPAQWSARKARKTSEYRDMAIAQVAGKLLRAVSLDPAFVATLVHDWNVCHCDPPLPEREVQAIFDRICEREIKRLEAGHA